MSQSPTISQSHTRWFKLIAIALPFFLILLLEVVLRWVGYGKEYPLFISSETNADHWIMNPQVSEKYFSENANATIGYQEAFLMEKGANTFRIFVLGASTAVGYPYLHNGSFHRWLQYRLNYTFPDQNIEIINLALTAVNSYTVLDFAQQLVNFQPDAVLIYAGHNEYYGALGVGSTTAIGSNPAMVRLIIKLQDYRTVQLLSEVVSFFRPSVSESDMQENLMRRMTAEQAIAYQSDLYRQGIQQYEANMTATLALLNQQSIPTFISTLFSNEKDLPPFISDSTEENSALDFYQLGQTAYSQQDFTTARQHFVQAKELDLLRFRAPKAINEITQRLADGFPEVHLVDSRAHLENYTPHGIFGNEVLLEHVHPNLLGYSLIADAFYQKLREQCLISEDWEQASTWEQAYREMPITEVDSLKGAYEIMMLKEGWPFYEPISHLDTAHRTLPEAIAGSLAVKQVSWEEAMEKLYEYYYQSKYYQAALKVAEAVSLEHPVHSPFHMKAAGLALQLGSVSKASYHYQRALALNKSPKLARKVAVNFIKANVLEEALPYLEYVMEQESTDAMSFRLKKAIEAVLELHREGRSIESDTEKMTQLAENYLILGKQDTAKVYLRSILEQEPTNKQALNLLRKMKN